AGTAIAVSIVDMTVARILCPTDFSETSAHAVDHAIALAGYYHAGITALHPVAPAEPSSTALAMDDLRGETECFFHAAAEKHIPVDVLVETGPPVSHIIDCARRVSAGVIVMGPHGASGFEHLVLGSVTEKVLRKAPCPVLTVPPRANARAHL